jgi:hypothetical protein
MSSIFKKLAIKQTLLKIATLTGCEEDMADVHSANHPVQQPGGGDSLRLSLVPVLLCQGHPDLASCRGPLTAQEQRPRLQPHLETVDMAVAVV